MKHIIVTLMMKFDVKIRMFSNTGYLQYVALFTGSLGIMCSGMHHAWPSPSLPQLLRSDSPIPITGETGSWLAIMNLIGSLFGSVAGSFVPDRIGRKMSTLLACIPYTIAWIMIAFASSVSVLIGARFIAGLGDGIIFCSIPMYYGEIASPQIRGLLGSSVSVTRIFGVLLINVIGSYLSIQMTALISVMFPVLCLLTFVWLPESPYYLLMKENPKGAQNSLQKFRSASDVTFDLERITCAVKTQQENTGKYLDLFIVKSNRKALWISFILRTVQQLSGINAIIYYIQIIFDNARFSSTITPSEAAIIYLSVNLIFCIGSSVIVDRTGRRPLLIMSLVTSSMALFAEGTYFFILDKNLVDLTDFRWMPLIALNCYVIFFSLGMQTIPMLILGEIFPTNVKAFALGLIEIYYSLAASAASKYFQYTKDKFGLYVPFYTFFACGMLGLILIYKFVPETKGKTLEDIQNELVKIQNQSDVNVLEK